MHDGIELESLGIPVAPICTTVFSKEAKNSINILRMPDFRVVSITHPLSTLTEAEIKSRALEAAIQIVEIITGSQSDLSIEEHQITIQSASQPAAVTVPNNIAHESDNGGCDDG